MCQLRKIADDVYVAEIKYDYIVNVIQQAKKCKNISRIILFGSSQEERCQESSDIDIAVFGKKTRNNYLQSAEFRKFSEEIFAFNNFDGQDYDILYFKDDCKMDSELMQNIAAGTEIYRSAA